MLRDSVSAWSSHSPVCTITAVSKDLFGGRLGISYDLSLATLSHELGVSFSRLRHDPPGSTRPVAGRPSMFVFRSMRISTPEIFGGRFPVIIVEPERYKAIDNTQGRASRLSSSGVPFAGLQPSPAARNWAAIPAPAPKG